MLAIIIGLNIVTVVLVLVILALIGACMSRWGNAPLILLCVAVLLLCVGCSFDLENTHAGDLHIRPASIGKRVTVKNADGTTSACESGVEGGQK